MNIHMVRMPTDARCVLVWSDVCGFEGEEYLRHYVAYGDDDGELIEKPLFVCTDAENAFRTGCEIAHGLEIITDDLIWRE